MIDLEARLVDSPDDAATWQVYADWLLEREDPRGQLVQLEQRLTRSSGRDRVAVQQAIDALRAKHEATWRADLAAEVDVVGWRHGFVAAIAVPWNHDAPALVARSLALPTCRFVRMVRFTAPPTAGDEDDDGEDELEELPLVDAIALANLSLGRVTQLELAYLRIGDPGAQALARSDSLGSLLTLDLRYTAIGDAGLAAVVPQLVNVQRLLLQRNAIGAAGVTALARADLPRLTELDLRYNAIGAEGAGALATAGFVGQLASLGLHLDDITTDGARLLASSALPAPLRSYWRSR